MCDKRRFPTHRVRVNHRAVNTEAGRSPHQCHERLVMRHDARVGTEAPDHSAVFERRHRRNRRSRCVAARHDRARLVYRLAVDGGRQAEFVGALDGFLRYREYMGQRPTKIGYGHGFVERFQPIQKVDDCPVGHHMLVDMPAALCGDGGEFHVFVPDLVRVRLHRVGRVVHRAVNVFAQPEQSDPVIDRKGCVRPDQIDGFIRLGRCFGAVFQRMKYAQR